VNFELVCEVSRHARTHAPTHHVDHAQDRGHELAQQDASDVLVQVFE
jgi:hypothetical protein